ncbi:MAG: LuxR C-terminal-related transcriptional regulator [Acidobacteriaceae bacterium]
MGLIAIVEENACVEVRALKLEEVFEEQQIEQGGDQDTEAHLDQRRRRPLDLVLLDIQEPLDSILQLIARLRREQPALKPVLMGDPLEPDQIQAVIGAGAKGFLLRNASQNEVSMAVEIVLDGSIWAPRKVLARLVEAGTAAGMSFHLPPAQPQEPIEEIITEREREVLHLLMSGRSNREIAAAMGIEQATVKAHLGRMLRKTRAKNRVELTLRAVEESEHQTG